MVDKTKKNRLAHDVIYLPLYDMLLHSIQLHHLLAFFMTGPSASSTTSFSENLEQKYTAVLLHISPLRSNHLD